MLNLLLEKTYLIEQNVMLSKRAFSVKKRTDGYQERCKYYALSLIETIENQSIQLEHSHKHALLFAFIFEL